MTESRMEAMAEQEAQDLAPVAKPEVDFEARVVPYSSVVGSSIMLHEPSGKAIGQLALLCFGTKVDQEYWAQRLARALNNGMKAEKAIARLFAKGLVKTPAECEPGKGAPVRTVKRAIDVRQFVESLDKRQKGGQADGVAIRGDKGAPD